MKRIFIIASERSGTNLLRVLLGKHNKIIAPVAPHFLDFFSPIIHYYGDLSDNNNYRRCVEDCLYNANLPYHDWNFNPSKDELLSKTTIARNLITITDMIYASLAESNNKSAYASKGVHNYNFVGDILKFYPDAKFIYLHRDPRDHAASWLKTPLFLHSPFEIVKKWKKEQETCLYLKHTFPESIIQVSYENLISNTPAVMDDIVEFMGLEKDPNCYTTASQNTEAERNEFWKNLSKPIQKDNARKYLKNLKRKDLHLIESYCHNIMVTLGYDEFETERAWDKSKSYVFHFFDLGRRLRSRIKNRKFFHVKMKELQNKLGAQETLKKRLINDSK